MILLQYVAGSSLEIFTLLIIIIRSVEDLNDVTQIITLHVKDLSRNSKAFTTDLFIFALFVLVVVSESWIHVSMDE